MQKEKSYAIREFVMWIDVNLRARLFTRILNEFVSMNPLLSSRYPGRQILVGDSLTRPHKNPDN